MSPDGREQKSGIDTTLHGRLRCRRKKKLIKTVGPRGRGCALKCKKIGDLIKNRKNEKTHEYHMHVGYGHQ